LFLEVELLIREVGGWLWVGLTIMMLETIGNVVLGIVIAVSWRRYGGGRVVGWCGGCIVIVGVHSGRVVNRLM
jgi:hypothetical protein